MTALAARARRVPLVGWVALAALLFYAPAAWWGTPVATHAEGARSWGVDDETPLGPLAQMHNIIDPKPDRNYGYPLGFSFLIAAAYAPYLGALAVTGGLEGFSGTWPFGLADPAGVLRNMGQIAHFITVLLAAACAVAAYMGARALWGVRSGILAAAFTATAYPMAYYGRTGNVDVPMLAGMAAAAAAYAAILASGSTRRRLVWLGLAAGIAVGTKEAAAGALAGMALVVILLPRLTAAELPRLQRILPALLASVAALGWVGGAFIDPHYYVTHLQFIGGRVEALPGADELALATYPFTAAGHLGLLRAHLRDLGLILTWPGIALAAAGIAITLRSERRTALLLVPVVTYWVFIFLTLRVSQLRYLIPLAWLLAWFAARAAAVASRRSWRLALAVLAVAALGLNALRAVDLTAAMLRDTRYAAGDWLAARLAPGDTVTFLGASNKLPPLPAGVHAVRGLPFRGMWARYDTSRTRADSVAAAWRAGAPRVLIVMPDHSSRHGAPIDASVPPALFDSLIAGGAGMELEGEFLNRPLLPWVRRPPLDYPTVAPPIRIFTPRRSAAVNPGG